MVEEPVIPFSVNAGLAQLVYNVKINAARGLQQVVPHNPTDRRLVLLAGGPSLNDFKDEIARKASLGVPVLCTNGTYIWCLEHGILPKGLIMVDAREFNARFVAKIIPNCKYYIASQCHPDVFDKLPPEQTWIWHSREPDGGVEDVLDEVYGNIPWFSIPGGLTVTLRAINLLNFLGCRKLDIYGFDSCLRGSDHHAYAQMENEGEKVFDVKIGSAKFRCTAWMYEQARFFKMLHAQLKGTMSLNIHGDGLIAYLSSSNKTLTCDEATT